MVKRTLMAVGLGVGLLGGAATAVHASTQVAARPAAVHASTRATARPATVRAQAEEPRETADRAGEADATVPCATDGQGNQTGNCQDSQNAAGPQDTSSAAESSTASGPDGDTSQAGDQTGPDTGAQAGQ